PARQLTLRMPFMPPAACPGTVQRYSYEPFRRTDTRSVFDWPGLICPDDLPVHELPSELLALEQSLKSCGSLPLLVILNTMTPRSPLAGDTTKATWAGRPAVTVTFETSVLPDLARALGETTSAAIARQMVRRSGDLIMRDDSFRIDCRRRYRQRHWACVNEI